MMRQVSGFQAMALGGLLLLGLVGGARANPSENPVGPTLIQVVRAYADALIERGRDRYGPRHSPLFATTLDRKRLAMFTGEQLGAVRNIARADWGIRPHDRMVTGANPMQDQNLYQLLYALSRATGEERYAAEADRALKWFFEHCQSPATGLMAWGEHIGWDFLTEAVIDKPAGTTHEFYRPWVLWDRCFRFAPEACGRFARGVWEHQIGDRETGNFSRHARYDAHGPGVDSEYPRHGGFYIATWAAAYEKTRDPVFLEAIETLVDYFDGRRSPRSGALPAESTRSKGEMMWPPSNLSLAVDLGEAARKIPEPLAAKMRRSASRTDEVFLKLPHELGPEGRGFLKIANTHTLDARQWANQQTHTRMWATGYGDATVATMANLCMLRSRQVRTDSRPVRASSYRALVLAAARRYMTSDVDLAFPVYPGTLGDVICLLLGAHELAGEKEFLDRAEYFAGRALELFFAEGSPLPKASSKHDHYEAVTRADTLMLELLRLWTARERPGLELQLVCCDR